MQQEDKNLHSFKERVDKLYQLAHAGKPTETGFDVEFRDLKLLSAKLRQSTEDIYLSVQGQKPENKKKNRYKDITPFDSTRVRLTVTNDDPNSDYINASFIKGAKEGQRYIASQGPLPHTVLDFWQMLWQYNVSVIVMVCREIELGKRKCERYWADEGEIKEFGGITVTLKEKEDLKNGYILRMIKAERGSESRTLYQFHYTNWPDHGVPKTCMEIVTLINHVRDVQSYSKDESTPLCVHCSAGCGRTGAVLAVDFVRNMLERKCVPANLCMFDIVSEMRRQRPAIVQTKDQYEFVNAAIVEMFHIYLQTRTVSYKDFMQGYQGEQYVNVNISSGDKSGDRRNGAGPQRPATLVYENVSPKDRQKQNRTTDNNTSGHGAKKLNSLEDCSPGSPPPKPSLDRPVSAFVPNSVSYGNIGGRKQSEPMVKPIQPKPRTQNLRSNTNAMTPVAHARSSTGSPITVQKENAKPQTPMKPKIKPEPASKNIASPVAMKPPPGGAAGRPHLPLKPKTSGEKKPSAPVKPQRSIRRNGPPKTINNSASPSSPSATNKNKNLQKYEKKNTYSEVAINDETDTPHLIPEAPYAEFAADVPPFPRTSSNANTGRLSPSPGHNPPELPVRTPESQILLSETPPALPSRTAESYEVIKVEDDLQLYESVDTSNIAPPPPTESPSKPPPDASGRKAISNPLASANSAIAAKAKKMFGNTTSAISKVGASIAKSVEDDNTGSPPSTLENRTPTYTPGPVMYNNQDMSFGKRLKKKVKGARKQK